MEDIPELRRQLAKEKAELEVEQDMIKRNAERDRLNAELRATKTAKRKIKFGSQLSFFHKLREIGNNVAVNAERAEHQTFYVGQTIRINNGMYLGHLMKIKSFIPGGIYGTIGKQHIRIRHGSYSIHRGEK